MGRKIKNIVRLIGGTLEAKPSSEESYFHTRQPFPWDKCLFFHAATFEQLNAFPTTF